MNHGEVSQLLGAAFPYGALAYAGDDRRFLSVRYRVEEMGSDGVSVLFVRPEAGDTQGWVSESQLREAAGSGWLDLGHCIVRRPEVEDVVEIYGAPLPDGVEEEFLGPQVKNETGWIARMRLHQSWWRTFVLRAPFGTGPSAGSSTPYGNMLDATGDAEGSNFLSDHIRVAYDDRAAVTKAGIDAFRTRRHLLSSQAMAFNLFGHLSRRLAVASDLFRALFDQPDIEVTGIEVERLSDALGDRTAFDAFATYSRAGAMGGVAIETKLTEKFSQQAYDWDYYLRQSCFSSDVWNTNDPARLGDSRWSQLWRNHLLTVAEASELGLSPATQIVVHHPEDPTCAAAVDGYRALLQDPDTVRAVDIGQIHGILDGMRLDADDRRWLDAFQVRYLDLERSAPLTKRGSSTYDA